MTECPQCGYDLNSCPDCAIMFGGGPVKRIRRWFCLRFGWHNRSWVSPADNFDTCLSCGEHFPHSPAFTPADREETP